MTGATLRHERIAYWAAPSLAEYITVAQHQVLAERQTSRKSVIDRVEGDDAVLRIERLEFEIPLAALYA